MINLFTQIRCNYKIYNDGEDLIKDLPNIDPDDIGLFITDLEMPGASGREVIDFIRKNNIYDNISILVHTNMSNDIMENELKEKDVAEVIGKVDVAHLSNAIERFMI